MTAKKVGSLIKEARTNAGLTQEKLARGIAGLSAGDISSAERGEKMLTQEQLKAIARATGVTQKSLLEAAGSSRSTTAKKTTTSRSNTAKNTGTRSASGKSAATKSGSSRTTSTGTSMKVSATEKRLVELYRAADTDTKKRVMAILRGDNPDAGDFLGGLLEGALESILKK